MSSVVTHQPMERRVTVPFTGPVGGRGPATWGQTAIRRALRALEPDDHQFNVDWGGLVEPGLTVEAALEAVRGLMYVHDSLRTLMHETPEGTYTQELRTEGELEVGLIAADGTDTLAVAEALHRRLCGQRFDPARDWPFRVGLVTRGGLVRYAVMTLSHTAVDGWALPRLRADMTSLVAGADPGKLRAGRAMCGPLDEAAFQRGRAALRRDESARSFILGNLARTPAHLYGAPAAASARGPRYRSAVLRCPGLDGAVAATASRLGTTSSTVLLAAACSAAARSADRSDFAFQVMVSNRFVPGLADVVAPVALEGVLYLPDCRGPIEALTPRVWKASVNTYRFAYYDKDRLTEQLRGAPAADTTCWYNDRRGEAARVAGPAADDGEPGPVGGADAPGVPAPEGSLTWSVPSDRQGGVTLALHVIDAPGALDLSLTADTTLLAPDTMEELLRAMERSARGGR
ncbi:condensation domain-containing protein [Streptomyces uncialis]|uniref:condensation domain-containing protein n=1 Tax=Streptomyces uncialis TaxID=1048205 RepID=UPI00386B2D6C|nr:condensation domain-containing protein [Streptomyces uncialis]